MPALPLWGVIVVVLSVASIIISLLFCLFRCRRFPRSTVDPAEYSHKKQGFPTIASEAISNSTQEKTICPTTTTTTTSNTQPFTPTTTTTSSSSSPSSPSSSSCSILPPSAHAYSGEALSEKHHEFDNPKVTPTEHHQEHHHQQKKEDFHISLPLPPPSTSFFADKMELNSDEATRMFEMYMSSADNQGHPNQKDLVSIDLTGTDLPEDHKAAFYDTISNLQQKATSTIRSTLRQSLRRQKSSAKKTTVQRVFDPVTIPTTVAAVAGKNDTFVDEHLPASPPLLEPPKSNLPSRLPDASPPSPPTSKSNDSSDSSSSIHQEDKTGGITLSSSPFHQLDEEADHQNTSNRTSLTTPRVSAEVSFGLDSTRTVKGRQLFDYNLDNMFAWPSSDSGDDGDDSDDDDDDEDNDGDQDNKACQRATEDGHHNGDNNDNVSITSGSVHRLVRDSTVVDTDHRSLAARSVSNSVRPSLHEMASWWSNDNESTNQDGVRDQDMSSDSPMAHDPPQHSQNSTHSTSKNSNQTKSTSISKAMASYSSSSPTSTFSRATLNKFRAALASGVESDQESDQESDNDNSMDDDDGDDKLQQQLQPIAISEPQRIVEETSVKYAVPDDELTPIAIPTFTEANTELPSSAPQITTTTTAATEPIATSTPYSSSSSTPSPSPPSSPSRRTAYENDSAQSSIKSRPVSINSTVSYQREVNPSPTVAAVTSIRSNARNSIMNSGPGGGGGGGSNVDSVRRVLQGTWNTHRYSDHGSIASSTRSNLSQGMSPPGSVNPRQLNQHLASLSLQSSGRHPVRPGLPTGFMNEDLLVPGSASAGNAIMGPQPTVSFSSSTVRTMIPEDEPIERHVGQKKAVAQKQQKPATPKQKQKKNPIAKSTTPTAAGPVKDQKQQSFGTMRTGRQQRSTMPWNADESKTATITKSGEKTPAQRERDRYLQSLKG